MVTYVTSTATKKFSFYILSMEWLKMIEQLAPINFLSILMTSFLKVDKNT